MPSSWGPNSSTWPGSCVLSFPRVRVLLISVRHGMVHRGIESAGQLCASQPRITQSSSHGRCRHADLCTCRAKNAYHHRWMMDDGSAPSQRNLPTRPLSRAMPPWSHGSHSPACDLLTVDWITRDSKILKANRFFSFLSGIRRQNNPNQERLTQ
ncbi:hypothetical protein VTN31DRAFT_965 [Thermomyces dupontii]|uniref:uncharacterized protein n=1 Tax=Talaromyces thermophilus TaxID=28565 RepID=UPI0037442028